MAPREVNVQRTRKFQIMCNILSLIDDMDVWWRAVD